MADDSLKDLERRFRTTGSIEDEVAWLHARRVAGRIEPARLELAAWLGHPAAQRVAGPDARDFHAAPHSTPAIGPLAGVELPTGWIKNAAPLHPELGARAGIAALNRVVPQAAELRRDCGAAVALAEDCVVCPCERHVTAAREAMERQEQAAAEPESSRLHKGAAFLLALVTDDETSGEADDDSPEARLMAAILGDTPPSIWMAEGVLVQAMVGGVEHGVSVDAISTAVRDELVAWLLGYSDPVRERVEARRRR